MPPSAFAPLANRSFLAMWIANLMSNVGGWMQTTGAAWEMTSLTQEPIFVALLAAAGTLPMFLFCFFAGILQVLVRAHLEAVLHLVFEFLDRRLGLFLAGRQADAEGEYGVHRSVVQFHGSSCVEDMASSLHARAQETS